jgi:tripartite-type tricarboxylate transporter receptor subunit TctC
MTAFLAHSMDVNQEYDDMNSYATIETEHCPHKCTKVGTTQRPVIARWLARALLALFQVVILAQGMAHAAYPDRPIRWIVPAAAGGGSDASVRVVADQLSRRLGQPIVIDNRPGASGAIGLNAVAKSAPDGYTIGTASLSNMVLNRQLQQQLPFDHDRDLVPVAKLTNQPNVFVVNPTLPIKDFKGFITYAKANPGKLFYGSAGSGSTLNIAMEAIKQSTGVELVHVPYKSSPAAGIDVMANNVQVMEDNLSTLMPHIKSGKMRGLAVTSQRRSPLIPEVPTMAEAGYPEFELSVWGGVTVPQGVPPEVVKKLADEIMAVLAMPEVKERLAVLGYEADGQGPAEFAGFIRSENSRWGAIIRKAGIKAE